MNLNLTFTAPVRFSILERFALQKGKKEIERHTICSRDRPLVAPAQKFGGSGDQGLGTGSIWESHLHPLPLRIPCTLG